MHAATKKYVDDKMAASGSGDMLKLSLIHISNNTLGLDELNVIDTGKEDDLSLIHI